MPSVKVKKGCFGGAGVLNQQRSLADIFPPPIRLSSGTPEPEPTVVQVENDAVQELEPSDIPGGVSGLRPTNRPRSSSRVSEHCMNRSSRMFRPRSHHDSLHATQTVHSQHSTTRNENINCQLSWRIFRYINNNTNSDLTAIFLLIFDEFNVS